MISLMSNTHGKFDCSKTHELKTKDTRYKNLQITFEEKKSH